MADAPKPAEVTPLTEASKLKQLANSWVEKFSGKQNYNPHLAINKHIRPVVDELEKATTLTDDLKKKIAAVPVECPCINPNFVADKPTTVGNRPNTTVSDQDEKKIITKAQ